MDQRLPPNPAPGATQDEVYYLLSDHLGSTTVTVNSDGMVKSRVRYDAWGKTRYSSGTTPTDRKYTGQIEEATVGLYFYNARYYDPSLGRFIQADTIIPGVADPQSWDRYAYVKNNPIYYNDPSGSRECESTTSYDCDWKIPYLWNRAEKILQTLGGKNDLKAMAAIINEGARVYKNYDSLLPALSSVFLGVNIYGPTTLIAAALSAKENGCAGVGRDVHDCSTNSIYFADTGFHKDFRDGHNQPYHVWGYIANSSSSNLYGSFGGVFIGAAGNYFHEGVQGVFRYPESGWGTSWEDYTLSYKGMIIGAMVSTNMIPPTDLGDFVLEFLGPNGSGSNGFKDFY